MYIVKINSMGVLLFCLIVAVMMSRSTLVFSKVQHMRMVVMALVNTKWKVTMNNKICSLCFTCIQ